MTNIKAPFPYFGGKSTISDEVWERFGNPRRYMEPFCGSAAVLLNRPGGKPENGDELINDLSGFVTNFYRAAKYYPDQLVEEIEYTISELDLHARRKWLDEFESELIKNLQEDPKYCHTQAAAWWCYGACLWIGTGWPNDDNDQIPSVSSTGGRGYLSHDINLKENIKKIHARLSNTKIVCGDWKRCLTDCALNNNRSRHSQTAIFFDPPYPNDAGSETVYNNDSDTIAYKVKEWCLDNQYNDTLKIALCGYEGTYKLPEWDKFVWERRGGFSNQSGEKAEESKKECIWFSPNCQNKKQNSLF